MTEDYINSNNKILATPKDISTFAGVLGKKLKFNPNDFELYFFVNLQNMYNYFVITIVHGYAKIIKKKPKIVANVLNNRNIKYIIKQLSQTNKITAEYARCNVDGTCPAENYHVEGACMVMTTAMDDVVGHAKPCGELVERCHRYGVPVFCDLNYAVGRCNVDVGSMGMDAFSLSMQNFYGPKSFYVLAVKKEWVQGYKLDNNLNTNLIMNKSLHRYYFQAGAKILRSLKVAKSKKKIEKLYRSLFKQLKTLKNIKVHQYDNIVKSEIEPHNKDIIVFGRGPHIVNLLVYADNYDPQSLKKKMEKAGLCLYWGDRSSLFNLGLKKEWIPRIITLGLADYNTIDNLNLFVVELKKFFKL